MNYLNVVTTHHGANGGTSLIALVVVQGSYLGFDILWNDILEIYVVPIWQRANAIVAIDINIILFGLLDFVFPRECKEFCVTGLS